MSNTIGIDNLLPADPHCGICGNACARHPMVIIGEDNGFTMVGECCQAKAREECAARGMSELKIDDFMRKDGQ